MRVACNEASSALAAALCLAACAAGSNPGNQSNASTGASGFTGASGSGFAGGSGVSGGFGLPGASGMSGGAGIGGVGPGNVPGMDQPPGGAGTGAGGASIAGSGAGSGGAGAGGASGNGGSVIGTGAYVVSGAWHGYAWTDAQGARSSIDPPDFSELAAGSALCASGTVGAAADYSGVAMVGVNLNQAMADGAPSLAVTPVADGIAVNVTNRGTSPLRLQVQGPSGASDPDDRFCVEITGAGGVFRWNRFNTACWDDSGETYDGRAIVAAMILVPGDDADPVPFDFCLNSIAEASDPGGGMAGAGGQGGQSGQGGSAGSGDNHGSGVLTDRYAWAYVMRDGRTYAVQNNVWGADSSQTVRYDGTTFEITAQAGGASTGGAPVSYPSAFIGRNHNRNTAGSNLPKRVSELSTIDTGWSHNAGSVSGTYNAAYDVWFSTGSGGDAEAPSGGYLMVWLYDPPDAQPIGAPIAYGVSIPGVGGSWDVWLGPNDGRPCISYLRTQPTTSMQFDLNRFIQDATGRNGAISSGWYVTNVFAGFEIWNGGVGLETTSFYAIVN